MKTFKFVLKKKDKIMGNKMKTYNPEYDYIKYFLSIVIIALHTNIIPKVIHPWVRVAVPLFFMFTAYFFFGKLNKASEQEKPDLLKTFIKRNLCLYGFWLIAELPITAYIRYPLFQESFFSGIVKMIGLFFFGATFLASWYIMAVIIGTIIIYYTSKHMNSKVLFVMVSLVYMILTFHSAYMFVFQGDNKFSVFLRWFKTIYPIACNGFLASLMWLFLGKCFSENKVRASTKFAWIKIVILCALLYIEWIFVSVHGEGFKHDCYFMLVPLCVYLFFLILQIPHKKCSEKIIENAKNLRKMSVINYCSHCAIYPVIKTFLKMLGVTKGLEVYVFFMTVVLCFILGVVIIKLQKRKSFHWLKYSY